MDLSADEAAFERSLKRLGLGALRFGTGAFAVAWHEGLTSIRPSRRPVCIVCGGLGSDHRLALGTYTCSVCGLACLEVSPDGTQEVPWPELQARALHSREDERDARQKLEDAAVRYSHRGEDPVYIALTPAGERHALAGYPRT